MQVVDAVLGRHHHRRHRCCGCRCITRSGGSQIEASRSRLIAWWHSGGAVAFGGLWCAFSLVGVVRQEHGLVLICRGIWASELPLPRSQDSGAFLDGRILSRKMLWTAGVERNWYLTFPASETSQDAFRPGRMLAAAMDDEGRRFLWSEDPRVAAMSAGEVTMVLASGRHCGIPLWNPRAAWRRQQHLLALFGGRPSIMTRQSEDEELKARVVLRQAPRRTRPYFLGSR